MCTGSVMKKVEGLKLHPVTYSWPQRNGYIGLRRALWRDDSVVPIKVRQQERKWFITQTYIVTTPSPRTCTMNTLSVFLHAFALISTLLVAYATAAPAEPCRRHDITLGEDGSLCEYKSCIACVHLPTSKRTACIV